MKPHDLPGPRGRVLPTFRYLRDPYGTTLAWRAAYGDPFFMHALNGDILMTGRAEHLRRIFAAPPESFAPFGVRALAPVVGESSVLVLGGARHKRERKLLMPPFHGARMRAYAETMREVALRRFSAAVGTVTTMQELAQQITLEIIVRALFGLEDQAEVDTASRAILEVIDRVFPSFLFAPWLQRSPFGLGPYARFKRAIEAADRELLRRIEARRRGGEGHDILGMLVAARDEDGAPMKDEEIQDELRTLIVAGHETTAMTLAFAVDHLLRSPEALARARAEASAEGPAAPFLDAVAKETLRLRPIVTEAIRTCTQPLDLGDLVVPAGGNVGIGIVLAHHDPERYPDPLAFRPERFLAATYGPTDFLPFGGGHRRCIGAAFAEMELRIVLATLLRCFDVTLLSPSHAKPVRRNLTMGPAGGVPLRLRRRVSADEGGRAVYPRAP